MIPAPTGPTLRCPSCVDGGDPGSAHSSPPDPCRTCGGWQRVPFVARTDEFLAAVRRRDTASAEREAHHASTMLTACSAIVEAVLAQTRGKRPKPPPERGDMQARDYYLAVHRWAREDRKLPGVARATEETFLPAFEAEQRRLTALLSEARTDIENLAAYAVFPRATERIEVYRPSPYSFSTQGFGEGAYLEADCRIRVALLHARGFDARVEFVERAALVGSAGRIIREIVVTADCPPELREALPCWRLDDQRLLDATSPQNLKVLFTAFFPYAGSWDWPVSKRELRDHVTFDRMRANEDAHLLLNGSAP